MFLFYTANTITKVIGRGVGNATEEIYKTRPTYGAKPHERTQMSTAKTNDKTSEPREIRRKLGLNQQQFWSKIGVTQSGGSRYESGRNMPRPVRELLRLVHVEQIDIQRIKRDDVDIVDYLKSEDPDLYKSLKKAAKAKKKAG